MGLSYDSGARLAALIGHSLVWTDFLKLQAAQLTFRATSASHPPIRQHGSETCPGLDPCHRDMHVCVGCAGCVLELDSSFVHIGLLALYIVIVWQGDVFLLPKSPFAAT